MPEFQRYPQYIGPPGFGGSPEFGGSHEEGEQRMRSVTPWRERLTSEERERIIAMFDGYDVEIKKIDKVYRYGTPWLRIWYNGELWA